MDATCESETEKSASSNLALKHSTVGINRNAHYAPKGAESSHQLPKSACTSEIPKGRIIKNKNIKRPPIPQCVLQRIEAKNPMPFDQNWKKMETLVKDVI